MGDNDDMQAVESRFSQDELALFNKFGLKLESVNAYPARFNGYQIYILQKCGCSAERAARYSLGVRCLDIAAILEYENTSDNNCPAFLRMTSELGHESPNSIAAESKIEEYAPRFDNEDAELLINAGIESKIANEYPERFIASEITILHQAYHCMPYHVQEYDERFTCMDAGLLSYYQIPGEIASLFPDDCDTSDILAALQNGILPDDLAGYKGYDSLDKILLAFAGITPEEANPFHEKFFPHHIFDFDIDSLFDDSKDKTVNEPKKSAYNGQSEWEILDEWHANFSGFVYERLAQKYDPRFSYEEISFFVNYFISPDVANAYPERFNGMEITVMHYTGRCTPESAASFDEDYTCLDIAFFSKEGMTNESALRYFPPSVNYTNPTLLSLKETYSRTHHSLDLMKLKEDKSTVFFSEILTKYRRPIRWNRDHADHENYHPRFSESQIENFKSHDVKPSIANRYHPDLDKSLAYIIFSNCMPEEVNRYHKLTHNAVNYDIDAICDLIVCGVPPWVAVSYPDGFDHMDIINSVARGILPSELERYDEKMSSEDRVCLAAARAKEPGGRIIVGHNRINENDIDSQLRIKGAYALMLKQMGFSLDFMRSERFNHLMPQLQKLMLYMVLEGKDPFNQNMDWYAAGVGNHAVVIMDGDKALKFSPDINHEAELLMRLHNPQYVVGIKGVVIPDLLIELEYFNGITLESLVRKEKRVPIDGVFKYMHDIIMGLIELREAGIYHRDLHDRNVMISILKDWAKIIDLGAATYDPHQILPVNRSYGANNDLISVGCLGYKMNNGVNPFNEGFGFSYHSNTKNKIKSQREIILSDPFKKEKFIISLEDKIKDRDLCYILQNIFELDQWTQPPLNTVVDILHLMERKLKFTP
jgi:hypothetical protein